jgi:hypothetical protein
MIGFGVLAMIVDAAAIPAEPAPTMATSWMVPASATAMVVAVGFRKPRE